MTLAPQAAQAGSLSGAFHCQSLVCVISKQSCNYNALLCVKVLHSGAGTDSMLRTCCVARPGTSFSNIQSQTHC